MHKYVVLLILAAIHFVPRSVIASDSYVVTLVSVWTNKPAMGLDDENVQIAIDDVLQLNNGLAKDKDVKDAFWRIEKKKTTRVEVTCLDGKSLGSSFDLELTASRDGAKKLIGKVNATLQREEGELRLAFKMKHGQRTLQLRRRARIDGDSFWRTRVFPSDSSANYVLSFQIEKKQPQE